MIGLGILPVTIENFPQYLEFRRKRLNITQVMLIDLLGCNISKIEDELLTNIVNLGKLIELKAIALRDVNKSGVTQTFNHNCYELWLIISNLFLLII